MSEGAPFACRAGQNFVKVIYSIMKFLFSVIRILEFVLLCGTFQNTNATFTSHASQFVFSTPYIISMSLFRTNHCQISTVLTSIAHKLNGFFISRVWSLYSKLNEKNSIGVQRFVGDAKQTLEIRVS